MTVWIVEEWYDYNRTDVVKVFDSSEKADAFIKASARPQDMDVLVYEVE